MVTGDKVAYFLNSCDSITKYIGSVRTKLEDKNPDSEKRPCVVVDCVGGSEGTVNLAQFYMSLCRKYGLLPNERTTLLSSIDQLIALQLCLAEKNKQEMGDFEVEASTVIQANKDIVKYKLARTEESRLPLMDSSFSMGQDILSAYQAFLKHCNYTDMCDILLAVCKHDSDSLRSELSVSNLVFVGLPRNEMERAMVMYLCEGRAIQSLTLEISLDSDEAAELQEDDVQIIYSDTSLDEVLGGNSDQDRSFFRATPRSGPQKSHTESYIQLVFGSYLELLVNSRAELALARSLNTPERELTHQAFTDLKHESRTKNMTMYQTALSYVMKIRLGGKGYAPDPNSPLALHVKGFGEFISLIQKLQTIIEEENDKRISCRKVLNIIKKEIIKCRENRLRISTVETVCEKLQKEVVRVINMFDSSVAISPEKPARDGGSAVGRHTIKVLRYIVDKLVSGMDEFKVQTLDFMCDGFSSQRTPIRFPCIMSQFRSPEEYADSPDDPHSQSLSDRLLPKHQSSQTPIHLKRYKSCMAWAAPAHQVDVKGNDIVLTQSEVIVVPSKTVVHAGKNTNRDVCVTNRVAETLNDQENIQSTTEVTQGSGQGDEKSKVSKPKVNKVTKETKQNPAGKGQKRPLVSDSPTKANKKTKTQNKTCRRKLLPQVKGQQQLTKFFRV